MTADTLKTLWPKVLAPAARVWVGQRLNRATIRSGSFKFSSGNYRTAQEPAGRTDYHLSATIEAADLQFVPETNAPPVEAPRALDPHRERDAGGRASGSDGYRVAARPQVPLKGVRFTIADTRPDIPIGEVTFRAVAPLPAMIELAGRSPYEHTRSEPGLQREGIGR